MKLPKRKPRPTWQDRLRHNLHQLIAEVERRIASTDTSELDRRRLQEKLNEVKRSESLKEVQ